MDGDWDEVSTGAAFHEALLQPIIRVFLTRMSFGLTS